MKFLLMIKYEEEDNLTFLSYIEALESAPVDVPMGGQIDFTGGKRWEINSMSLLKYEYDKESKTDALVKRAEIESIEDINKNNFSYNQ